jgi:hypothetical protein
MLVSWTRCSRLRCASRYVLVGLSLSFLCFSFLFVFLSSLYARLASVISVLLFHFCGIVVISLVCPCTSSVSYSIAAQRSCLWSVSASGRAIFVIM